MSFLGPSRPEGICAAASPGPQPFKIHDADPAIRSSHADARNTGAMMIVHGCCDAPDPFLVLDVIDRMTQAGEPGRAPRMQLGGSAIVRAVRCSSWARSSASTSSSEKNESTWAEGGPRYAGHLWHQRPDGEPSASVSASYSAVRSGLRRQRFRWSQGCTASAVCPRPATRSADRLIRSRRCSIGHGVEVQALDLDARCFGDRVICPARSSRGPSMPRSMRPMAYLRQMRLEAFASTGLSVR